MGSSGLRSTPSVSCLSFSLLVCVAIGLGDAERAVAQEPIRWDVHHDQERMTEILERWAGEYPGLASLDSIGSSYQGRTLWLLTLTNRETGAPETKSALWIDANIDGVELLSKEMALYFADYLLRNYGRDERVTEILDRHTVYVLPDANPDPSNQLIREGIARSVFLKPWDSDQDGRPDDDPPEDIDGDGLITAMRVEDPDGEWKVDPDNPHLMVRREASDGPGDGPFYRRYPTEGIDNDGDGRINEDWRGGFDANRSFPANWQPAFRQDGAPPYPLYTPSARALVDAVLERRNIAAALMMHTSGVFPGGTLWQPPGSTYPKNFPAFDMNQLYPEFGSSYDSIMRREGYPHSCATSANIRRQEPRGQIRATGVGWAYLDRGIIAWTPELWSTGVFDYDGDCSISREERWRWSQEEWDGRPFVEWHSASHPELGEVEVGGWRNDFEGHGLTPPEGFEYRMEQLRPWLLEVAESLPRVTLATVDVEPIDDGSYEVVATVQNRGLLPTTSTRHAADITYESNIGTGVPTTRRAAQRVKARVSSVDGTTVGDSVRIVGHMRGLDDLGGPRSASGSEWPNEATVRWVVTAPAGSELTVRAGAPRAGTATRTVQLPE